MDRRLSDQLDKVIAMADSSHDGEAVVAVRMARQLLSKGGLRFSDLAQAALGRPAVTAPAVAHVPRNRAFLEEQLARLQQQFDILKSDLNYQSLQAEFWRRRAGDLEQDLVSRQTEIERWKNLAQETVDKLWELGQNLQNEEFTAPEPVKKAAPKA